MVNKPDDRLTMQVNKFLENPGTAITQTRDYTIITIYKGQKSVLNAAINEAGIEIDTIEELVQILIDEGFQPTRSRIIDGIELIRWVESDDYDEEVEDEEES